MFLRTLGRTIGRIFRASAQVLLWVSVAMTLIAGGFYFLPRVTVEPSGVYDPKNPSAITFTIGNINIVPIRDVQFGIGLCYIVFPGADQDPKFPHCNGPASTILHFQPWDIKWLDVDEKYQIALEDFFKNKKLPSQQIDNADLTIAITYTPWRMPWFWRNTKEFRFVTQERSDGKVYWTPTPLNR